MESRKLPKPNVYFEKGVMSIIHQHPSIARLRVSSATDEEKLKFILSTEGKAWVRDVRTGAIFILDKYILNGSRREVKKTILRLRKHFQMVTVPNSKNSINYAGMKRDALLYFKARVLGWSLTQIVSRENREDGGQDIGFISRRINIFEDEMISKYLQLDSLFNGNPLNYFLYKMKPKTFNSFWKICSRSIQITKLKQHPPPQ